MTRQQSGSGRTNQFSLLTGGWSQKILIFSDHFHTVMFGPIIRPPVWVSPTILSSSLPLIVLYCCFPGCARTPFKECMGFPTAVGCAWNVHRVCVPASGKACLMRNILASYCMTATINWHPCRRRCQAVKPRKKILQDKSLMYQLWRWAPLF